MKIILKANKNILIISFFEIAWIFEIVMRLDRICWENLGKNLMQYKERESSCAFALFYGYKI